MLDNCLGMVCEYFGPDGAGHGTCFCLSEFPPQCPYHNEDIEQVISEQKEADHEQAQDEFREAGSNY